MMKIYENERVSRVPISISQIGVPANCGQRTAAKGYRVLLRAHVHRAWV